ncbi:MAG: hypothetical protein A3I63_07025 [Betaproteobacteria bacterium RIFCSPLOWO2_02_FULL_66_14]|nr:MAG: hypothetical protein A3I63_07025 [Betaproteobacteria bacterium RIFCSPLOWO2_02_FULL_66_14]
MKDRAHCTLVEYDSARLDELVRMWRASFEAGVGIVDPNPIADQKRFFLEKILPLNTVRLAIREGELLGFVATSADSISQLFVRVGYQREGIGSAMLEWAKDRSVGSLWLYTFARNAGARAFYERHGFVAVAQGFEPIWQLEDVRYQWTAQTRISG